MAAKKGNGSNGSKKDRKAVVVEVPSTIVQAAKKEMAREDISDCQAIRNVAKKFKTAKRGVLQKVFTDAPFKMNKGTVNRQIQEGRTN